MTAISSSIGIGAVISQLKSCEAVCVAARRQRRRLSGSRNIGDLLRVVPTRIVIMTPPIRPNVAVVGAYEFG